MNKNNIAITALERSESSYWGLQNLLTAHTSLILQKSLHYFQIYDAVDEVYELLGSYSQVYLPPIIISSQNKLFLKYERTTDIGLYDIRLIATVMAVTVDGIILFLLHYVKKLMHCKI